MAYDLDIKQCFLVNNDCYKQGRKIKPSGIVVHSTGADNPYLKRYVQPNDGILGANTNKNDWNRSGVSKCVHAFIGKDNDGNVRIYQTLPWDYRCWGCASGKNGSYNNSFIQFEICEDSLTDEKYFNEAFVLAIKLCEYLCNKYGISISNVVSHQESYKRGYASNHGDCDHWLKKFGKDMNWFRSQINNNNVPVVPTTSTTVSPTTRSYLMKGDKGDAVKELQENLNYLNYPCGAADGVFGSKTETALKNFQKDYKLTVDGKYGANSKKTLESAIVKKKSATTSTKKFVHNNLDYSLVFDPVYYSKKYSDIKKAFGTNSTKLFEHFLAYGRVEGRQAISTFNPVVYKNRYPDLQELFKDNMASYYNHYIMYGFKENRKGI